VKGAVSRSRTAGRGYSLHWYRVRRRA